MTAEKPKHTPEPEVGTITPLMGVWIAKCCVCGKQYAQHCGSTPCCGSVAQIIANDEEYPLPKAAALSQAREALEAAQSDLLKITSFQSKEWAGDVRLAQNAFGKLCTALRAISPETPEGK